MPSSPANEPEPADERDLEAELAQMEDRFKRAAADLDNYRKRVGRDIERLVTERRDVLLREWFEVLDTLDRALAQSPDGPASEALAAVREQMESVLARHDVHRVGAVGEPFDPSRHEAVEVRETGEAPDRTVVAVARSGFARGDHVLRPAQVVVARAPQPQQA